MNSCPICKNNKINFVLKIVKVWTKKFPVYFCGKCEFYFLNKKPSLKEVKKYYQGDYYEFGYLKQGVKNLFRYFRSASQFLYTHLTPV
jgi:hypothetical protein